MTQSAVQTGTTIPRAGLVRLTHVMYGLHAFSVLMGMIGPAFIVTAFLTGWPSIVAVIVNYVKRPEVCETYLDSHFGWQIRTFWYALLWLAIGVMLVFTVVGTVIAVPMLAAVGIWVLYRIIRGWIALNDDRPIAA